MLPQRTFRLNSHDNRFYVVCVRVSVCECAVCKRIVFKGILSIETELHIDQGQSTLRFILGQSIIFRISKRCGNGEVLLRVDFYQPQTNFAILPTQTISMLNDKFNEILGERESCGWLEPSL